MATTYETCPQDGLTWVYPDFYGLTQATSDFDFSKALPKYECMDANDEFLVVGGRYQFQDCS